MLFRSVLQKLDQTTTRSNERHTEQLQYLNSFINTTYTTSTEQDAENIADASSEMLGTDFISTRHYSCF